MGFFEKKSKVLVKKDEIIVSIGKEKYKVDWGSDLKDVFEKLQKEKGLSDHPEVIVSDDLKYKVKIKVSADLEKKEEQEEISEWVKTNIPEEMNEDDWEYRQITSNEKEKEIEIVAPMKSKIEKIESLFELEKKDKKKKEDQTRIKPLYVIFVLILILGSGIIGLSYYFNLGIFKEEKGATVHEERISPTPAVTLTATPTPVNLSEYSIQVLNGTGEAGEASYVEEILLAEGFEEIETGNADSYNYTVAEIYLSSDIPEAVYESIERALNSEYELSRTSSLNGYENYDVVIITGERL